MCCLQEFFAKSRRKLLAFTLVELVVALALAAFLTPPLVAALKNSVRLYKIVRDERIAEKRAETVAAVLKMPLRNCALALPVDSSEYKKYFNSKTAAPFSWDGPLSVTGDGLSSRLRVAYAFPEGSRTSEAASATDFETTVQMTREPDGNYFDMDLFDKSGSVKNWVLFVDGSPDRSPLTVTRISGKSMRLKSFVEEDYEIPQGASLYLFRAVECWSDGEKFYTRDFRTTGGQPRVDGVCGASFELNDDKTKLTLCLMVRGEDATLAGSAIKNRGCPQSFLSLWDASVYPYALYAFRFVWHLPNAES